MTYLFRQIRHRKTSPWIRDRRSSGGGGRTLCEEQAMSLSLRPRPLQALQREPREQYVDWHPPPRSAGGRFLLLSALKTPRFPDHRIIAAGRDSARASTHPVSSMCEGFELWLPTSASLTVSQLPLQWIVHQREERERGGRAERDERGISIPPTSPMHARSQPR